MNFFKPLSRLLAVLCFSVIMPSSVLNSKSSITSPVRVLFFGDSLTAGYGLSPDDAYPALIELRAKEEGLPVLVTSGAVSGDTSAGGLRRIDWMLRQPVDIFVLALGANDGLRGLSIDAMESNLQKTIDRVRDKNPEVTIVIAGMYMPDSLGEDYVDAFAAVFPRLARKNDATLIPFLLEGVAQRPEYNLPDQIHPNQAGHKIIAETVWSHLQPIVGKR